MNGMSSDEEKSFVLACEFDTPLGLAILVVACFSLSVFTAGFLACLSALANKKPFFKTSKSCFFLLSHIVCSPPSSLPPAAAASSPSLAPFHVVLVHLLVEFDCFLKGFYLVLVLSSDVLFHESLLELFGHPQHLDIAHPFSQVFYLHVKLL